MANYDLVYEGSMADVTDNPDLRIQLEAIYRKFNLERPDDFTGHSLSVSDVVVVRDQAFYGQYGNACHKKLNRWSLYVYYPAHMIVLLFLRM